MIEHTSVDGIETVFSPRPGPLSVGLTFRVGMADETLPTRGITHMVEHLALHRAGLTDYHANGSTGGSVTTFLVAGGAEKVTSFMELACQSLTDLPLDRLDTERAIIATEESRRAGASDLALWRHGAAGWGLLSYPEWGIKQLTPEQIQAWAHEWFTAENAVLWVSGEAIPELRLPLPRGVRKPNPVLTSTVPQLPAFYAAGRGQISFDSIVERSTSATVYARLVEKLLYQSLRQDSGVSYGVSVAYDPFTDTHASIAGFADALEENEAALVGQFVDSMAAIDAGRIDPDMVQAIKTEYAEQFDIPDLDAHRLPATARDLLYGAPILDQETLERKLSEVTIDSVREVATSSLESTVLRVPYGESADWGGYEQAPLFSLTQVEGPAYRAQDGSGESLVLAGEGVSALSEAGPVTVRFADVAAVLAWPDGAVHLIGRDGLGVRVEPALFGIAQESMEWLYNAVPRAVYVEMPERNADEIPQPIQPPTPPPGKRGRGLLRRRRSNES